MTVANAEIADTVGRYLARHPDERPDLGPLLWALDAGADLASRATVPGHITCGAAVIDDRGRVLVIHHKTLNRWLLPGGHLEPTDTGLLGAAVRELGEETGIRWPERADPPSMDVLPIDIDLHQIPVNHAKGEPEHWHADFRYAFRVMGLDVRLQRDEVTDYGWQFPSDLHTTRLATKINYEFGR